MKKLLYSIYISLVVIGSQNCYAGTISVPAFSADSTVTHLEQFRTTVVNVINGAIAGSAGTGSSVNIQADTIAETEMYDDVNPRIRDKELVMGNSGIDTFSSGTLTQYSFVSSGCTPATDSDLTSDISACVAYVAGYRISKGATSQTYTASMDTYVDLSSAGVYTLSAVANGATQPAVASNSARLAKVVTSGTAITSVTDLANRRIPGLVTPTNFRSGLVVSGDTSTTIKVFPGTAEINNSMVSKSTTTTLTLTTAGDWAGGSSLQAANTYGYVGMDASGNLKMHTTAPAYSDYAVSSTAGKKRYSTWSSTVYRILGWFYMNSVSSGTLSSDSSAAGYTTFYEVGNIKEGDVSNATGFTSNTPYSTVSTTNVTDSKGTIHFYSSGNPVLAVYNAGASNGSSSDTFVTVSMDSTGILGTDRSIIGATSTTKVQSAVVNYFNRNASQGGHTFEGQLKSESGNTGYINQRTFTIEEK